MTSETLKAEALRLKAQADPATEAAFDQLCRAEAEPMFAPVDWRKLWDLDDTCHDWLVEPILPAGRQVAIYAMAKAGKSLLALDVAAALATGSAILGRPAGAPMDVVYVDLEMTREDLRDRLADLGYGPDTDLSHLHYYLLPLLPPLDRPDGGQALLEIVQHHQASVLVIDTMARAVAGEENSADTYRHFVTFLGRPLKTAGVTVLRLDHAGKDGERGQRGSSAKADDVDVVFKMTADGRSITIRATHSRIPWIPPETRLTRQEEPLRHVLTDPSTWPAGTSEVAALLDQHDVPLDASSQMALTALKIAGDGRRKTLVLAALKWRKEATR